MTLWGINNVLSNIFNTHQIESTRMRAKNTFTIHTELIDGTLSGARNIYMGANSTCHLYVIPREEINIANNIADIAGQPTLKKKGLRDCQFEAITELEKSFISSISIILKQKLLSRINVREIQGKTAL